MTSIIQRIRNIFGRNKPKPPRATIGLGHRGIAAGDLAARHAAKVPYTLEEIGKWEMTGVGEAEGFIYDGKLMKVHSSNVESARYNIDTHTMEVFFLDGSGYLYSNVSEEEAIGFVKSASKGGFLWSTFRIRGTKNGHKKPYKRIR